jgi:hypothetical protein
MLKMHTPSLPISFQFSRLALLVRRLLPALICLQAASLSAGDVTVRDDASLAAALAGLTPGTCVKVAPGDYKGGHHVSGVDDLTIEALDPARPPHFRGGKTAFQFTRCQRLKLQHLKISGQEINGLNLDDGGQRDRPVQGVTLAGLEVSDIGPSGNHDAIKCSGLEGLTIRDCLVSGWGGQGIDFVGCHRSVITGCRFTGKLGFSASAGIQLKGGTSEVVVEKCWFKEAGERPVNVGGSTGLEFFRPAGAVWEAKDLTVQDCVIEGSLCAAAFVGVDGAVFRRNTILHPGRWVFRILQETTAPGFVPCRRVSITDNKITFRRSQVRTEVNIGAGTEPSTFSFSRNHWFAEDDPGHSRPQLPVPETDGVYGTKP